MRNLKRILLAAALSSLCASPVTHAAGFELYELGAPVTGTAGVGQAALANDASTSYYNPAGMPELPSSELMIGSQIISPVMNFQANSSNTITGSNGGTASELAPGLDLYYVYSYTPKLKFGISLTQPYGGAFNYENHWVGRYSAQQMLFYTLNLNPSLAFQVNDQLAVGAGVAVEYANLYQTVALPLEPGVDGQATLKVTNVAPGFNAGLLFTPSRNTRIGVAYRSQIIHNFSGNLSLFQVADTATATTRMTMPQNVIASVVQKVGEKFSLLGEVGWSDWSSMVDSAVTVAGFTAIVPQHWHDTYRVGLGAQFQYKPFLLFQLGGSYDSSPTSSSRRLPVLPMDRQVRAGAGLVYTIARVVKLGLSYEYINFGNASINNTSTLGTLSGSYSRNYANVLQASLNVEC
jgi:long-chain fatty acid transport protein